MKKRLNKIEKLKRNTELLQNSWYERSYWRVVFLILRSLNYLGTKFLINKNRKEKLKKQQGYAKYVNIRLVGLIMFEPDKL